MESWIIIYRNESLLNTYVYEEIVEKYFFIKFDEIKKFNQICVIVTNLLVVRKSIQAWKKKKGETAIGC